MKLFFKHKKVGRRLISMVILMGIYGYIVYQEGRIDVPNTESFQSLSAPELLWRFQVNEGDIFLNQVVSVSGIVTTNSDSTLVLNNSIYCMMAINIAESKIKLDTITVKGRCLGYYEPLKQVQLDNCFIDNS